MVNTRQQISSGDVVSVSISVFCSVMSSEAFTFTLQAGEKARQSSTLRIKWGPILQRTLNPNPSLSLSVEGSSLLVSNSKWIFLCLRVSNWIVNSIQGLWKCVGLKGTVFTDIDLGEGEWSDYDEKVSLNATWMDLIHRCQDCPACWDIGPWESMVPGIMIFTLLVFL